MRNLKKRTWQNPGKPMGETKVILREKKETGEEARKLFNRTGITALLYKPSRSRDMTAQKQGFSYKVY
jgi:hypothetical protein